MPPPWQSSPLLSRHCEPVDAKQRTRAASQRARMMPRAGVAGVPTSATAPGPPCARKTTAPTVTPGTSCRTTWARSKAYRWGEDGIAGICDRYQILLFAPAFWNSRDPILKERLFGLSSPEGNHGEDVKEYYFHLDCTPTHSYMRYLYKYPQREFPYDQLLRRTACDPRPRRNSSCWTPESSPMTPILISPLNMPN